MACGHLVTRDGMIVAMAATIALALSGCGAFRSHRASLERLHASGDYEEAAERLDDEEDLYRQNRLLWELDRGAVALALDEDDEAIEHLEVAERMIDLKREQSPEETIATWLVSERAAPYLVEPFEDLYVNVLKLLAQLEAGRIEGGATVEARRLARKADLLRDRHAEWADALDQASTDRLGRPIDEGASLSTREGEYIESPLGTYLSALAFMEAGETEMQRVAARRLLDTIEREQGLIGPVDASRFDWLEDASPDDVDLLVVALSGRGPTKVAERVGPIVIYTVPIYFELPRMSPHPSRVAEATVEIEGLPDRDLALVEDMALVATENHERHLPLVRTRTLLRAAAKAAGTAIAAESVRDDDGGWATLAIVLGGLAYMLVTERADLRSWVFLPGQARVGTVDLEPGTYRLRTVYRDAGGSIVHTTPWREVDVEARGLETVVEHYWR